LELTQLGDEIDGEFGVGLGGGSVECAASSFVGKGRTLLNFKKWFDFDFFFSFKAF
jgi:hypothetical protein